METVINIVGEHNFYTIALMTPICGMVAFFWFKSPSKTEESTTNSKG